MSLGGTLEGAALSAAFVVGISMVSTLQRADWTSFYPSQTLFFNIHHYWRLAPGIPYSMPSIASVSTQLAIKC